MSKRTTKASQIVSGAKRRLENARLRVEMAKSELALAQELFDVHETYFEMLSAEMAPKPRKASTKKQASAPAPKETTPFDTDAKCGICGHTADHSDHDRNYIKSHDFEPPKSVARAPRRSGKKSESTPSIQSTEGETENALAASNAGD